MTAHAEYVTKVRERLNKLRPKIEKPNHGRRGPTSVFTTVADEMAKVAKERGEWPWKQKKLSVTGTPKDLPNTLRRFAEGESGMWGTALRLCEIGCINLEVGSGKAISPATIHALTELESQPEPNDKTTILGHPVPEPDAEINAMREITYALDGLDERAIRRILAWAADKYGVNHD